MIPTQWTYLSISVTTSNHYYTSPLAIAFPTAPFMHVGEFSGADSSSQIVLFSMKALDPIYRYFIRTDQAQTLRISSIVIGY